MKLRLFILQCLILCLIAFVGCSGGNSNSNESDSSNTSMEDDNEIPFNVSEIVLGVGDEYELTLQSIPSDAGIRWKSSDSKVVKVVKGKLTGLSVGVSDVTATVNSQTATCRVTVKNYEIAFDERIEIFKNETYGVDKSLKVDGVDVEANKTFRSKNESVVTVSDSGVITGHKMGETEIVVTVNYETWSKEFIISVFVNIDLQINVTLSKTHIQLATGEDLRGEDVGEAEIILSVTEKESDDAWSELGSVNWTIDDDSVASIVKITDTKATVTAIKSGSTKAYARFDYNGDEVYAEAQVDCYVPCYESNDLIIDGEKQSGLDYVVEVPSEINVENVISLKKDNNDIAIKSKNGTDNTIVIGKSGINVGINKIKLNCGKTEYTADLVYATKTIRNKQDFVAFATNYANNAIGEYYVLLSNVDLEGTNVSELQGYTGEEIMAWNAIFDGRGHALYNGKIINGLFTNCGTSAVIKNIAVIDFELLTDYEGNYKGGFICNDTSGTIENCYVKGKIKSQYQGAFMMTQWNGYLNNCVGLIEDESIEKSGYVAVGGEAKGSGNNVYVVSADGGELAQNGIKGGVYTSLQGLLDSDLSGLTSNKFWTIIGEKLFFGDIEIK